MSFRKSSGLIISNFQLFYHSSDIFRNRWQLEQAKRFEDQYGSPVDCSEDEWLRDWKKTVEMASTKMSTDTKCLSGLEEIHIFVLSNVLRRPIVILCDDVLRGNYDESLADVNMGGIYLPLLSDSVDCVKSPLVIGYHQGHFTALVTTEDGSIDMTGDEQFWRNKSNNAVPLVKNDGSAMKMQFLLPEEKQHSNRLLREYLDCSEVEHNDSEGNETILVAIMQSQEPEPHLDQIFKKYFDALQAVYLEKLAEKLYWSSNRQAKDAQCKTSIHGNTPSPSDVTYPSKESDWSGVSAEIKTGKPPVPCCSAHKRCKTTGCKYYTTQGHDLCYRCKKHEKQMCTSPGCEFRANPGYQGLCSTCFTRYHAIMEQGKNTAKPSAPPSNFCRSKNCQKQASPALLNFCVDCYLSTIQNLNLEDVIAGPAGEWNSSTGTQLSNQPSVAASSVKKFSKDVPNEAASKNVPSATAVPVGKISRQVSLFCSNKNCHNHLENSTSLYCNECMENMATSMPSSPSIKICHKSGCSGIVNSGVSDDMCNSCLNNLQGANGFHQPNVQSSSTTTFDICSVSGCTMPAVTYHGELCLAHYQQSQSFHRNQQQRNYDPLYGSQCESLFKAQGTLCINTGCTFYGDPDNNYLCSYCHSKALQEQYDMERIKLEQDRAQAEWLARTAQYSGSSAYGFYELKNLVPQRYHFDNSGITPRKPFYIQVKHKLYFLCM